MRSMGIESKICPSCGQKNNPIFQACWKCKASLKNASRQKAEPPLRAKRLHPSQIKETNLEKISRSLSFKSCTVIGIDLGTSNSRVCGIKDGRLVIIPNKFGEYSSPSTVMLTTYGGWYVGHEARNHAKRFEFKNFVAGTIKRKILKERGTFWNGQKQHPQFLFALILAMLKKQAEEFLGCPISGAVLSVPASFGVDERQIIKDAGEIAGIKVLRLINEPTAASLVYGMNPALGELTLFVYDLGGGTFDASIIKTGECIIEVKGTCGDMSLGGKDFDDRLMDYLCQEIASKFQFDVKKDSVACMRLEEAAEEAKKNLSFSESVELSIPYFYKGECLNLVVKRSLLEEITKDLVEKSLEICKQALNTADLSKDDIDGVLLIGGQTRMPAVRRAVERFFGNKIVPGVDPETLVVRGNTLQSAVLAGDLKDCFLLDVQSHPLGIGVAENKFVELIGRNTTIPTRKSEIFSTTKDNQTSIAFQIYEGKETDVMQNRSIGSLSMESIFLAKAGTPKIEITFDVDANGMLIVSACDLGTGKSNKEILVSKEKLSRSDMLGLYNMVHKWIKSENSCA